LHGRIRSRAIAREHFALKTKSLSPRTLEKKLSRFEAFIFPQLGKQPIHKGLQLRSCSPCCGGSKDAEK
jgi:hypothetical protein